MPWRRPAETYVIPQGLSFAEAGAFPIAYISSHVALRWQGRLEPGETLLVLGAAGGVGLTAVEIGKAMGARVIAAASTAEKLTVATAHGADATVNYASEKLTERVMALTGDKGADVCFDPVGGGLFDAALSALGWGGRILLVGFVGGVPQIPANRLLVKHRAALGSSLRYFRWHAPDKLAHSVAELLRWHGEGKLRPCISHRLPLERAVEGIRLLIDRQAHGKIVVELEARMTQIHLSRPARHVALITIDNPPKMNAMTRPMLAELGRLWDELERDDSRCIVITGAGEACLQRRR